jgi:CDP-paratose 2-epimerase
MGPPVCVVTGSAGLIGSEVSRFLAARGCRVHGIDNNQRAVFFGSSGDTRWNQERLQRTLSDYHHHAIDVRDRPAVTDLIAALRPGLIVHAAAQPSHDRAAAIPFDDFETNALATLTLLEAARRYCRESPFVFMSTNKVYGDRPNAISIEELPTRWDFTDPAFAHGIPESLSIDQSSHSLFGASKLAADVLVQEYGRYFGMPTCCLRAGCVTGPHHAGVELHGFLSYLVKCNIEGREYKIFGYKGKQVRDNLHAEDVARFIHAFWENPRSGEVYNIGGGKANACSILEAFALVESFTGRAQVSTYVDEARRGDHICYYSDLRKVKAHYPGWAVTKSLQQTMREIVETWHERISA